jgi:Domain of unknown function (DUF1772)
MAARRRVARKREVVKLLEFVALVAAALFAGAALYINVAEHPARSLLDARSAVAQWAPSYHRATFMQAPLALASAAAGFVVWAVEGELAWLVAALLIGAVVPFTFIGVMPTNRRLLAIDAQRNADGARALLARWNRLHAVRTVLSLCATAVYAWLAFRT